MLSSEIIRPVTGSVKQARNLKSRWHVWLELRLALIIGSGSMVAPLVRALKVTGVDHWIVLS